MTVLSAAIFDVDGVLLDSLGAHLQVCRDEAQRMNLSIAIPTASEFRALVSNGAIISPMEQFFRTVGFPPAQAREADDFYRREFANRYPVHPFPGIRQMVKSLADLGLKLGIVTSNTRQNISGALKDSLTYFDDNLIFADDDAQRMSKAQALTLCAKRRGVGPGSVLYVGDQPRDFMAAQEAHTKFIGVTYGWGIEANDSRFPTVNSPGEVADHIATRAVRHVAQA
jgi:phosphoglycolate phosphatase-like HAD superfamily hydrolase